MNRRRMLRLLAGTVTGAACGQLFGAPIGLRPKRMGIEMHSYSAQWRGAREKRAGVRFSDALGFLEYAHELGAGGVQAPIGAKDLDFARRIAAKAEEHEMYFEAQFQLPADDSDLERFENDVRLAREARATVFRAACLSSRRYETFKSAEEFREFRERSWKSLVLAEPVLKRHQMRVAVENHKDWLIPELLELLQKLSSEWVGVCVDTGNNIALMEDATEVMEAFAPFAFSTHVKDMGVQEYADGFLLSEVPLGNGFVDLKRGLEAIRKANPAIRFNLEMITRDPLRIPCLTQNYWATFGDAPASRLARALGTVKKNTSRKQLPKTTGLTFEQQLAFEDANVRESLRYAKEVLGF